MGKVKTVYICQECGYETPKWMGKCPGCGSWNTLIEEVKDEKLSKIQSAAYNKVQPLKIQDIEITKEIRYSTFLEELDRVLGGGIVKGSLVLVG
ncbi:MAG: DNA repair protein RadA, partial [Caloramator sp.]|nr:DNA repair protein RadA [Caloramator sp.]